MKLLTTHSPKIILSNKNQDIYHSAILYLSPHNLSGHNVCAEASVKSCAKVCLNGSGRGRTQIVQQARIRKTQLLFSNRELFKELLYKDLNTLIRTAERKGKLPAVRLNGTSDLDWIKIFPTIFSDFSQIQFYDYCKIRRRYRDFLKNKLPKNYHLTFSRHELNEEASLDFLKLGGNVAVIFRNKELPSQWRGYAVHNGDTTDLRFLDSKGVIGLYAKGPAKHDQTGFVVDGTYLLF